MTDNVGRPYEMVRGLCPRDLDALGGGRKAGAPWETLALSATPDICTHPTPAIPQRRGVEDAAPYGRQQDVGISIVANRRVNAASFLPPFGSPYRGAERGGGGLHPCAFAYLGACTCVSHPP